MTVSVVFARLVVYVVVNAVVVVFGLSLSLYTSFFRLSHRIHYLSVSDAEFLATRWNELFYGEGGGEFRSKRF